MPTSTTTGESTERIEMKNRLCYIFYNVSLVTAMPIVLFFALLGIEQVCGTKTVCAVPFIVISTLYITMCGCAMAINIEKEFKDT